MTKKLRVLPVLLALFAAFASLSARAEGLQSQSLFFSGTCTGTDQLSQQPFSPAFKGTITGGDIVLFENPASGISYAFAGIKAGPVILWAGPQQTHATSFAGFSGFNPTTGTTTTPGGFLVTKTSLAVFDLNCNSGSWQAFLTIWYVAD
jgi:hypothetical protein